MNKLTKLTLFTVSSFFCVSIFAAIKQLRVINSTNTVIYVHKGGFAPSVAIKPSRWKVFSYPFVVIPPGSNKPITTSVIAASAGGRWMTSPNGFTTLHKPTMIRCLDYGSAQHAQKKGNRRWIFTLAKGFDKGCKIKGYKQPWYQGN